jgi:hypothetical protein
MLSDMREWAARTPSRIFVCLLTAEDAALSSAILLLASGSHFRDPEMIRLSSRQRVLLKFV